jgi:hypothetical protein
MLGIINVPELIDIVEVSFLVWNFHLENTKLELTSLANTGNRLIIVLF